VISVWTFRAVSRAGRKLTRLRVATPSHSRIEAARVREFCFLRCGVKFGKVIQRNEES
jgi:hypothetical protein